MINYKRTFNQAAIRAFLLHDEELLERLSEDGSDYSDFVPSDSPDHHWVDVYDDEEHIGMFLLNKVNNSTYQYHMNVLERYRKKGYSIHIGFEGLHYFLREINAEKMIAIIPVCYPEIVAFSKKLGFKKEGINRLSIKKNGVLMDQQNIGITKEEIIKSIIRRTYV